MFTKIDLKRRYTGVAESIAQEKKRNETGPR